MRCLNAGGHPNPPRWLKMLPPVIQWQLIQMDHSSQSYNLNQKSCHCSYLPKETPRTKNFYYLKAAIWLSLFRNTRHHSNPKSPIVMVKGTDAF
jgi:hypothetical protein